MQQATRIAFLAATLASTATAQQERWSLHGETRRQELGGNACWLGDVDGDGVRDFAVGLAPVGSTYVPIGGGVRLCSGVDGSTLHDWVDPVRTTFGAVVASAGDLDGDGRDDMLVGAPPATSADDGAVSAWSGASGARLFEQIGAAGGEPFGASLAGMGDLDGDGTPDFAIGIPTRGLGVVGRVEFRSGRDQAVLGTVAGSLQGSGYGTDFGGAERIAAIGDVDGDGRSELLTFEALKDASGNAVCNVDLWSGATRAPLWRASPRISQTVWIHQVCVRAVGDVDGDGTPDGMVGVDQTGVGSWPGFATVLSGATGATLHHWQAASSNERFGCPCFAAGDLDGDGDADVGFVQPTAAGIRSLTIRSGRDGSELQRMDDDAPSQQEFATALAGGVDVDGDGRSELLIGSLPASFDYQPQGSLQCRSLIDLSLRFQFGGVEHDSYWRSGIAFVDDQDGDGLPEVVTTESGSEFANLPADRTLVLLSGADGRRLRELPVANQLAGRYVALPDVNGDGVSDFAVGGVATWAQYWPPPYYGSYPFDEVVHVRSGADLSLLQAFQPAVQYELFGAALAAGVQASGAIHLAIGVPSRGGFTGDGGLDLFDAATGALLFQVAGDAASTVEEYGSSIAFLGDIDGDGVGDWAVGAPGHDAPLADCGRVSLVSGVDGSSLQELTGTLAGQRMGRSVLAIGDQDGDGVSELAIASDLSNSTTAGKVVLRSSQGFSVYATIKGSRTGEYYGRDLAALPDCNGDGLPDFVVGATEGPGYGSWVDARAGRDGALLVRLPPFPDDSSGHRWLGAAPPSWLPTGPSRAVGPWLAAVDLTVSIDGARTGRVALLELDDLYLELTPPSAAVGDTVEAATRGGPANALAALFLESIDGAPVGQFLAFGALDAAGSFAVTATVPSGLAGQEWSLFGFAIGWNGRIVDSQPETLRFE
ncbi:MAG: FG-GAP repeat protein [Planctomycetes bacterium]|nr:FG-GAP repeat protein [Planctomycetota bacterium]